MTDVSRPNIPLIAICGKPRSGKSELQKILAHEFGVVPFDDGRVIRDTAKRWFGLNEQQVSTQEGKDSCIDICGKSWQVRKILGDIGQIFEDHFGEDVIAETAIADAIDFHRRNLDQTFHLGFSFGSVRKNQGFVYKRHGGIVIEVDNERVPESIYAFDKFNPKAVDFVIANSGTLEEFHNNIRDLAINRLHLRQIDDPARR